MATEIIEALQKLCIETGSLACLGCGHEHNCGIHGCKIIRAAITEMDSLCAQLEASQRREKAAVEDLHHNDACSICVGSSVEVEGCDAECLDCKLNCRCKDCRDKSKWQWHGPQKSEKEDSDA